MPLTFTVAIGAKAPSLSHDRVLVIQAETSDALEIARSTKAANPDRSVSLHHGPVAVSPLVLGIHRDGTEYGPEARRRSDEELLAVHQDQEGTEAGIEAGREIARRIRFGTYRLGASTMGR